MNVRGVVGQVTEAAKHAAAILVAKAATNRVSAAIPVGGTSVPMNIAKQIAVGVVLSMLAKKFAPRYASDVLIGALLAPMTTALSMVPVLGPALAGAPPGLGLYAQQPAARRLRGAPPGLGRVGGMGLYNQALTPGGRLASYQSGASYYD